jgi:beta-lactam-binding protein with PASTA domain
MERNWWVWLFGPAAVTTALLVGVAKFAGDGDDGASGRAAVTTRAETTTRPPATTAPRPPTTASPTARTSTTQATQTTTGVPTTATTSTTTTTTRRTTTTTPRTTTTEPPTTTPRPPTTASRPATTTTAAPATSRPATSATTRRTTTTRAPTTTSTRTGTATTTTQRPTRLARVPDLLGLNSATASRELKRIGFRPKVQLERSFQPEGTVVEQAPSPNSRLRQGQIVRITVSFFERRIAPPPPPAPRVSTIPRLTGLDYWEASARMELLGVVANTYPVRSKRPELIVVRQVPKAGTRAFRGARMRLTVSVGRRPQRPTLVPDTVGLLELRAHSLCRDARLTCRTIVVPTRHPRGPGRVVRQRPATGEQAKSLAQMTLFVGR